MTSISNVTVLGTGVLGSQIAFQAAYYGKNVTAYDITDEILETAKERFHSLSGAFVAENYREGAEGKAAEALKRISYSSDLAAAVADADLVIEAVPENIDLKRSVYQKLAAAAPEKTIFATNSSTLLPSAIKDFTGRPDRFLALHFANHIWVHNTAEVMGSVDTDPAVYATVVEYARETGMVPIEIKKEQAGYVLNSLLVPLLDAAANLLVEGIADPETIDKTWVIGTGAPLGPFQIFDVVGLNTAYNIVIHQGEKGAKFAALLKENYIDKGKLGIATGEGFYTYTK